MHAEIKKKLLDQIQIHFDLVKCEINSESIITGGCINKCICWDIGVLKLLIKSNSKFKYPNMFDKEKTGLDILRKSNSIRVPKVYFTIDVNDTSFIVMEFIEPSAMSEDFWKEFAIKLSKLHKCSNHSFGLEHDNYIGSLVQLNRYKGSWSEFFIEQRLQPQIKFAYDNCLLHKNEINQFEKAYKLFDHIFPLEPPALLHGDLWSGNYLIDENGFPAIIDPAVYFGHREMELAFTILFGGFNLSFYQYYNDCFPLEKDFEVRKDIYNLYPLLVHLNLFGSSYLSQIKGILRTFN